MNELGEAGTHHRASWIFYTAAAVLGLSFSAVLLNFAWNNSLESAERAFAYELVSFDETARTQARAADSALQGFARLLRVRDSESSSEGFAEYCRATLREQPYVRGVAWYAFAPKNSPALALKRVCVAEPARHFPPVLSTLDAEADAADLRATLEVDAGMPVALGDSLLGTAEYAIARRVKRTQGNTSHVTGIVMLVVDAQNLLGKRADESAMPFE